MTRPDRDGTIARQQPDSQKGAGEGGAGPEAGRERDMMRFTQIVDAHTSNLGIVAGDGA